MNQKKYKRVPKNKCIKAIDLVLAAQQAGNERGESISCAEATDALVTAYHGDEMLFDGSCTGLVEPYSEKYSSADDRELAKKMDYAVGVLYTMPWWNPSDSDVASNSYLKYMNLMFLRNEADAVWDRMCEILFSEKSHELWQFTSRLEDQESAKQGIETTNGYTTPYLTILNAAIAKFFEPRRERDAKKDEVVDWIKTQMSEAGMADSDNIAAAIFTIIKPADHDPRKRKKG